MPNTNIALRTAEAAETLILFHQNSPVSISDPHSPSLSFSGNNVESTPAQLKLHRLNESEKNPRQSNRNLNLNGSKNNNSSYNLQNLHSLCQSLSHITTLNLKAINSINEDAELFLRTKSAMGTGIGMS
jgi:hypothetical protein